MPRSPSGIYSAPPGTIAVSGQTIASASYNAFTNDLVQDANAARPLNAGGTGAATDVLARENLGVYGRSFLIDTTGTTAEKAYDNQVIEFTTSGTLSTEPAADLGDGWRCYLFASGGAITINPNLDETINGAATYVLPEGASGVLSVYNGNFRFEAFAPPSFMSFRVHKNGVLQNCTGTPIEIITFPTKEFDVGNHFDTATNRLTPPAGKHALSVSLVSRGNNGGPSDRIIRAELRKNGTIVAVGYGLARFFSEAANPTIFTEVEANGTDYFQVSASQASFGGAFIVVGESYETWFCGHAI